MRTKWYVLAGMTLVVASYATPAWSDALIMAAMFVIGAWVRRAVVENRRTVISFQRPTEDVYRAGYDFGYDEGFRDGRQVTRPTVVRFQSTAPDDAEVS